jgi:hypothetical protein
MMVASSLDCPNFIPLVQTQQSNQSLRVSLGPLTCVAIDSDNVTATLVISKDRVHHSPLMATGVNP